MAAAAPAGGGGGPPPDDDGLLSDIDEPEPTLLEKWNSLSADKQQGIIEEIRIEARGCFFIHLDRVPMIYHRAIDEATEKLDDDPSFEELWEVIDWLIHIGEKNRLMQIFRRHSAPFLLVPTVGDGIFDKKRKRLRLESKFTSR